MPSTTQEPLAAMEPHEALAVFFRLHSDVVVEAQRLTDRVEQLEGHLLTLLEVVGKKQVATAANSFYFDANPENVEYLDSLVARVKS